MISPNLFPQVFRQAFANVTYELVILHPKHFLPCGSVLPVYSGDEYAPTFYQVAPDGVLRRSPANLESPRLPPFSFNAGFREAEFDHLNPLLVAISSQIKFRRYQRSDWLTLEEHYRLLMAKTKTLVDAIYWKPVGLAPAVKPKNLSTKDEGPWSGEDRWSGGESEEGSGSSEPVNRDHRARPRYRDAPIGEDVMEALEGDSDFTMDQMLDAMSGPNGESPLWAVAMRAERVASRL